MAAVDSCFVLVRTRQYSLARRGCARDLICQNIKPTSQMQLIRIFVSDPGFSPLHCNILPPHSIVREFPKDTVFTFVEEIKRFRFLCSYVKVF